MKNKTVKLILGLVVLGVLTGGYFGLKSYVASQEAKETAAEEEEEKTDVVEVKTDEIQSLKFMVDKQEVTFVREDGSWVKEDEKNFPVDSDVLDDAASDISAVSAERVLENVEDLNEYGLDSPSNTITIVTDDNQEIVIRVGIENESTNQYYIRKDDDKSTVYVVEESLISPFMKSLYDYAKMQDFPTIDSSMVSRVSVEQNEHSYEAIKDDKTGLWSMNSENYENEKADSSKMSSLVSSLSTLEYDSFVDYNCTDKSKYGLNQPYAKITIDYQEETENDTELTDEENAEETISDAGESAEVDVDESDSDNTEMSIKENAEETVSDLGESAEVDVDENDLYKTESQIVDKQVIILVGNETNSDSRFVMLEGSNEVFTITTDLLSTVIDKDASAMWDMSVSYVSLNDLDSLDVEVDGKTSTINVSRETKAAEDEDSENDTDSLNESTDDSEKVEETVVTYQINGEELDNLDFSSFYNKLTNMVGQKRLTEEYHPETNTELSVVFHKLDKESVNVDYYEYDVNYYAAVVDNDKIYLVNKMTFRELKTAFEKLTGTEE